MMPTALHRSVRGWRCDLYCRVIDNFGDAGVCWRLANQLAERFDLRVKLIIDRPQLLWLLAPEQVGPSSQRRPIIDVVPWSEHDDAAARASPADLVIAAFGCRVPAAIRDLLAARRPRPVCINLEYLSFEPWAQKSHGLPSIDPVSGLTEYFFIPGLAAGSGGLIREPGLIAREAAFAADHAMRADFCKLLDIEPRGADETWLLLFSYPNAPLAPLLNGLAALARDTRLLIPEVIVGEVLDQRLQRRAAAGARFRFGRLLTQVCPFVAQSRFDQLLWLADLLLVRGEDSCSRALWSGRPFVWQLYPQPDAAHLPKLTAFLDFYCADMPPDLATMYRDFSLAWNGAAAPRHDDQRLRTSLPRLIELLPALTEYSARFRDRRIAAAAPGATLDQPDQVQRLLEFAISVRQPRLLT